MPRFDLGKFNNKHFLALMGNGILSVFSMGFIFLLSYSLNLSDLGTWFYFTAVMALCESVRNGFLNTATVKFYAGTKGKTASRIIGSVWVLASFITGGIALINALGLLTLPFVHDNNMLVVLKWAGLTFVSSLPYSVAFWLLQAEEDYLKIMYLRLVNSGSMISVFAFLAFTHTMTLDRALLYNFLTNCLTSVVAVVWGISRVRHIFNFTKEHLLEISHFGKYSLATTFSSNLFRFTDTFLITYLLDSRALAIYALPGRLMELVEIPLRSFVGTGMSGMAVAYNNKNMGHVAYILKKYAGMLTIFFIPLTLAVLALAEIPINILGHYKFQGTEAANIYRVFMVFALMAPFDRFNGVTLDIIHQPKYNFYKVLVMLVVNAVGDVVGVYMTGDIWGIVFAGFFTTLSGIIYGHYQLTKYVDYTIADVYKEGIIETKAFLQKHVPFLRGRVR